MGAVTKIAKQPSSELQVRIRFEYATHNQVAIINATSLKECSEKTRTFIETENLGSRDILSMDVYDGHRRFAVMSYNGIVKLL